VDLEHDRVGQCPNVVEAPLGALRRTRGGDDASDQRDGDEHGSDGGDPVALNEARGSVRQRVGPCAQRTTLEKPLDVF
jgi:hypothetical protein